MLEKELEFSGKVVTSISHSRTKMLRATTLVIVFLAESTSRILSVYVHRLEWSQLILVERLIDKSAASLIALEYVFLDLRVRCFVVQ